MLRVIAPWNLMVHGGLRSNRSKVNIIAGTAATSVSYGSIKEYLGMVLSAMLSAHCMSHKSQHSKRIESTGERLRTQHIVIIVFRGGLLAWKPKSGQNGSWYSSGTSRRLSMRVIPQYRMLTRTSSGVEQTEIMFFALKRVGLKVKSASNPRAILVNASANPMIVKN